MGVQMVNLQNHLHYLLTIAHSIPLLLSGGEELLKKGRISDVDGPSKCGPFGGHRPGPDIPFEELQQSKGPNEPVHYPDIASDKGQQIPKPLNGEILLICIHVDVVNYFLLLQFTHYILTWAGQMGYVWPGLPQTGYISTFEFDQGKLNLQHPSFCFTSHVHIKFFSCSPTSCLHSIPKNHQKNHIALGDNA